MNLILPSDPTKENFDHVKVFQRINRVESEYYCNTPTPLIAVIIYRDCRLVPQINTSLFSTF